ncbi:hypothetical protein BDN70DRAFT_689515 [Pholiota conissans]|uniref:Uncharacterized protein n=1 Tax=Pholiota conissans TaxID=109636 RepID=A0A9P5YII4_9AGAR|nr:hypothetical protein BDN70DRAFT_689515 [Pholiota conissans]
MDGGAGGDRQATLKERMKRMGEMIDSDPGALIFNVALPRPPSFFESVDKALCRASLTFHTNKSSPTCRTAHPFTASSLSSSVKVPSDYPSYFYPLMCIWTSAHHLISDRPCDTSFATCWRNRCLRTVISI